MSMAARTFQDRDPHAIITRLAAARGPHASVCSGRLNTSLPCFCNDTLLARRYFSQPGYVWPSYYYNARSRSSAPPDGVLSEPDTSDDEDDHEY